MITTISPDPARLDPDADSKDFSYESGERQTAVRFDDIRRDHSARYVLATQILKKHFSKLGRPLAGLDLFCGNGYGTWLASKELAAHTLGIDGSPEAIAIADRHFTTQSTIFSVKRFPFQLPASAFDFILCFESIEHVSDPEALFQTLTESLKPGGVLFVSTPNEATMPLAINAKWFRHHERHFREHELVELANRQGQVRYVGQFGQKVYRLDRGRVVGLDERADMLPVQNCPTPHFFIQLFLKPGVREAAAATGSTADDRRSGGCDDYTPGVVNPSMLDVPELRLDVGCGEAGPRSGHVGVDIRALRGIGILSSTWGIDQHLAPSTVAAFYSRHTLEHITFPQVKRTFASWFRLLKPGGRVHIVVPDLAFHIAQFLDPNHLGPSPANPAWTQRQHALAGFYGWQREADHKLWDVHKCGYTFQIMGELLAEAGFIRYARLDNKPWHLEIEAYKPA